MRAATTVRTLSRTLAAVVGSLWLMGSALPAVAIPAHLFWAEDVVDNIAPADNAYGTSPAYLTWAGVNGATAYTNRTQCSPFVTRVLKQAYNWTDQNFSTWFNSSSPTSARYHDVIVAGTFFVAVTDVTNIQEGDILAVKYLDGSTSGTGHMMIAASTATPRTATAPLVAGTTQYAIEVIDSSNSGHGPTDTRLQEDGTWKDGVGRGILRLYADATGAIVGYSWSTYSGSVFYEPATRSLVVGRLP